MHQIQKIFGPNYFFWSALKVPPSDFIQNMSQAPSKCFKQRIEVDKWYYIFPFPPTWNGNNQPYPLFLIKYELRLPSEATLGHLPFRFRSNQCVLLYICLAKEENVGISLFPINFLVFYISVTFFETCKSVIFQSIFSKCGDILSEFLRDFYI